MQSLEQVRAQIDDVDRRIIALLAERAAYTQQVSLFKKNETDIVAEERQRQVYSTRRQWALEDGLDPELIETLYRLIIDHNIRQQRAQLGIED